MTDTDTRAPEPHLASDPSTGSDPILGQELTVTIEGRTYTMRRLGIRDTFRLARIMGSGARVMGGELGEDTSPEELIALLTAGLGSSEDEAIALLASLIGVDARELTDPDAFPMGSELAIIETLVEHQDLRAFFDRLGKLVGKLPETQTRTR